MVSKRNGEIDFLRFFFAIIIVFYHFNASFKFGFFANGYIGVEFFFLVSGFLMARHAEKRKTEAMDLESIPNETWSYLANKVKSFYLYYFSSVILQTIVRFLLVRQDGIAKTAYRFLRSIPVFSLTFLGLNSSSTSLYVGNTWYLSAMLISMFVLYPFLLRRYHFSVKFLFPLLALFLLGYMNGTNNKVTDWDGWAGLMSNGLLRAFAEIALGVSLYPLSTVLLEKCPRIIRPKGTMAKILITLVKISFYAVVVAYGFGSVMGHKFKADFFYHAVLFCSLGIILSFTNSGYCIPDSKLTRYLGKISLPIFIYHGFIRWTIWDYIGHDISVKLFVILIVSTVIVSVLLMHLTDFLSAKIKKLIKTS